MLPARGVASTGLGGLFPEPAERKAKVVWSWWGKEAQGRFRGEERHKATAEKRFFHKNIDASIKRLKQHFKSNFLKMSTENYFCSAMIQWPAMLLNNGGTLSSYALKKKKNLTKIQRKPKHNWTNYKNQKKCYLQKKKSYLRSNL